MQRLIFLLMIFASLTGISQTEKTILNPHSSVIETIPSTIVTLQYGGMSLDKTLYSYSLNDSPIEQVDFLSPENLIYPKITLTNLKLKPDANILKIYYWEGNILRHFSDTLFFIHPKLTPNDVTQKNITVNKSFGYYIIHMDQKVIFNYKVPDIDTTGYPTEIYTKNQDSIAFKISQIRYKPGVGWKKLDKGWKQPKDPGILAIDSFQTGLNQLVIQYETKLSKDYPQDTISFYYTGFELDTLPKKAKEFWKKDTIISLNGYPSGGWFTGNGIEGNSLYFNPSKAAAGNNSITYHFPYKGKDLKTTDTVSVLSYDFYLSGVQSVCANSSNVDYTVSNYNEGFDYTWTITGGTLVSKNKATGTVNWDKNAGVGLIRVTASHKLSTYKVTRNLSVYKTSNLAYDVPTIFFGDKGNRLVISSFTSAYEYYWTPDDINKNTVITKSYFYYFNDTIKSKIKLTIKTKNGCATSDSITLTHKASFVGSAVVGNQVASVVKKPGSMIFPNPARHQISISVPENMGELMNLTVYDAKANLMLVRNLNTVKDGEMISLDVSGFLSGTYFVVLKGSAGDMHEKFMVIK